jgi:hypothetical protein
MGMPDELRRLLEKYCALGRLLPPHDDFEEPLMRAEAELVLREMASVQKQIDTFLGPSRPARPRQ